METKYTLKTSFIVIGHGIFETAYTEIIHESRNYSISVEGEETKEELR